MRAANLADSSRTSAVADSLEVVCAVATLHGASHIGGNPHSRRAVGAEALALLAVWVRTVTGPQTLH